jgi:hypothetical protein
LITLLAAAALAPVVLTEQLANGAWVVAIPMPGARTFAAQTFVRTGSVFEAEQGGSAHLLEHLLFTDGQADAAAERAGLLLNATTYREFMRLHTEGPQERWKQGAAAVGELLRRPTDEFVDRERRVILEEDALARLDPDELAHRGVWQRAAAGSPWARLPMGVMDSKANVSTQYDATVLGSNVVAVLAGDFDSNEALAFLRQLYAALPKAGPSVAPPLPNWAAGLNGEYGPRYVAATQVAGYCDPVQYLAAEIAFDLVTSPARLHADGLSAKSFLTPASRGTLGVISFQAMDGAANLATRTKRAISAVISQQEFEESRSRIRARYAAELAANRSLAIGLSILFTGGVIDFRNEIEKVTKSDVDGIIRELSK